MLGVSECRHEDPLITFAISRSKAAHETMWAPAMLSDRSRSEVATSTCGVQWRRLPSC